MKPEQPRRVSDAVTIALILALAAIGCVSMWAYGVILSR